MAMSAPPRCLLWQHTSDTFPWSLMGLSFHGVPWYWGYLVGRSGLVSSYCGTACGYVTSRVSWSTLPWST